MSTFFHFFSLNHVNIFYLFFKKDLAKEAALKHYYNTYNINNSEANTLTESEFLLHIAPGGRGYIFKKFTIVSTLALLALVLHMYCTQVHRQGGPVQGQIHV